MPTGISHLPTLFPLCFSIFSGYGLSLVKLSVSYTVAISLLNQHSTPKSADQ
ncbi:MAG: hypothetical protein JWP89_2108 [Schlesneria sp.]|nr:hypothetical protein [Schlesneria sp.]